MLENLKQKMIQRRAAKGANFEQSVALLEELLSEVAHGDNLEMALHYEGFATQRQAEKFTAALQEAA